MQLYITVFSFIDIEGQSWYYYLDDVLKILLYNKALVNTVSVSAIFDI